jgi:hypothetical protein
MGQQELIDAFIADGNRWVNSFEISQIMGNPRYDNKIGIIAKRMTDILEYDIRITKCPRGTRKRHYYRLKPRIYEKLKYKPKQ